MKSVIRLARVCGFITPFIAYGMIFMAISKAPWFSWFKNALSDLGARSPSDIYFNSGLVLAGFLEVLFSIGLILTLKDFLGKISAVVLLLDSISLMGIGFFPETAGRIHFYFSVVFFLLYPISSLFFGLSLLINKSDMIFGVSSVLMTFICLFIWFIFPWRSMGVTGVAIPEFLSSFIGCIWMVYVAYKYLV
ncbi:MAG: DUF998 domain-containing protein [Candidatus Methanomethylicia archaeon]